MYNFHHLHFNNSYKYIFKFLDSNLFLNNLYMILSFYFIDYLKYYIIKATKTRRILRYYKYSLKYFQLYYKKYTTTIFSIFNIYKKEQLCILKF